MHAFTDLLWLTVLAEHLPQVKAMETPTGPHLVHRHGLTLYVQHHNERLQFTIANLYSLYSTGVLCPTKPPPPITVDRRRVIVRIANELQRRLITPGLQWYETALLWQQEDNEAYTAQRLTINAFVAAGGHPHPDYSTRIDGHRWRAQVDSAHSITLHLTSLPPEKALAIVQLLAI